MAQWKAEEQQQFEELLRRAEKQSRELAALAPPPPAPPVGAPARCSAPAPPAAAGGGAGRARDSESGAPGAVGHPSPEAGAAAIREEPPLRGSVSLLPGLALDSDALLILVLLIFLLRQHADRELIWALVYVLVF